MGTHAYHHREKRRSLRCYQRIKQPPELGLRGRPLRRSRRNHPYACRRLGTASQAERQDANLFFLMGVLRFPRFMLRRQERRRSTLLERLQNGADRPVGSRLHVWHPRFGCGYGFRICRRKRHPLSSRHSQIYSYMAAQLYAEQPKYALARG